MDKKQLIAEHWESICKSGKTDLVESDCEEAPEWCAYDDDILESGGVEHLVLTDVEATRRAAEYVRDSLWAFQPWFLSKATGLPSVVFRSLQENGRCEDNNEAISSIVSATCGITKLARRAIEADGRGHFLSGYDGEEREVSVGDKTLYFYRTN